MLCNSDLILMPSLGGGAVLTSFVGAPSCFRASDGTTICVPHLLRPEFFPLLCSFLKHPVSSGFQEWADCVGKERTLRSSFWLNHLIWDNSRHYCFHLTRLSVPPLAILMQDSPDYPPAGQCWCRHVTVSEGDLVLAPGCCCKRPLQFELGGRAVRGPAQSSISQLDC